MSWVCFYQKTNKIEKFWEIESFETKIINDIVCDNFHKDICFREGESRYLVQLSYKDDQDLLLNNYNHCKTQIRNCMKKFSLNTNLLDIDNLCYLKSQLGSGIIEPFSGIKSVQVHYLPDHPVSKERKPQKFVWLLMQVQTLLDLPWMIVYTLVNKIAFNSGIEKAFKFYFAIMRKVLFNFTELKT